MVLHTFILGVLLFLSIGFATTSFWKMHSIRNDYSSFISLDNEVEDIQIGAWAATVTFKLVWLAFAVRYKNSITTQRGKHVTLGSGFKLILGIMYLSILCGIVWAVTITDELNEMKALDLGHGIWHDWLLPMAFAAVLLSLLAASWQVMIVCSIQKV